MLSLETMAQLDTLAVENFREYLRIPSVHPNINYDDCVKFLDKQAKSLDLPMKIYYIDRKKPIVIFTWKGSDPFLPTILLNSHMDVVPAFSDQWTYPPFSAHLDEKGNIFARGSQDMKCVGIQYLEAIRRLQLKEQRPKRTVHVSFVPEEEIGGVLGMKDFTQTNDFKSLHVGFALDEGVANPTNSFYVFNGERSIWHVHVHCPGSPGHGSMLLDDNAGEKIRIIIDKFMDFRAEQKSKLSNSNSRLGDVTSINLTKIYGGVQTNVIPNNITAVFDIRLDPEVNHDDFESMLQKWCQEAGKNVHFTFEEKNRFVPSTKLDNSNPYWIAFKKCCDEQNINLDIGIFPGGTDSRYIRDLGIPALGFSPMNNTKILLHDHDEHLNKDVFIRGIQIYEEIIKAISNV
ncbi:aminoacylase-1-like [Copidosoma floridanum]|uniref:aminoacylase-1-like n=1 Tax=Copidosoma floridanum TaxID=29053 RepID=UPI0006C9BD87|nr:aminoacylase-1-like [Copidosoma floridanum]